MYKNCAVIFYEQGVGLAMFYYWTDFEKYRDSKRILIIYGAGVAGKHFVNINGLKPKYFYDKYNAIAVEDVKGNLYPVYQLNSVPVPSNSDVIVSLTRQEHLKEFMANVDLFPKECNMYFFPTFNFETLGSRENTLVPVINGKPTIYFNNVNRFNVSLHEMLSNGALEELNMEALKNLFFYADDSFGHDYLQRLWDNGIAVNKNGYLTETKKDRPISLTKKINADSSIYLFGNCAFLSHWSCWLDSIEGLLLNDDELSYELENYSHGTLFIDDIFIEMMNIEFKPNSIAILNYDPDISYGFLEKILLISKRLKALNIRFVFIMHFNMILKKTFGKFEQFLANKIYSTKAEMVKDRDELKHKNAQFQETMLQLGVECYNYSGIMYDEVKDVFVDKRHVSDLGNKYIAEFVKAVILRKVQLPDKFENVALYSLYAYQALLTNTRKKVDSNCEKVIGAIVMNCNPFTNGHRFLIEQAVKRCDSLIIFVVSENKSYFSFEERLELVKRGISDLSNVAVIPSGSFIISQFTFSDYFKKDDIQLLTVDCERDLEIFGEKIAPYGNIKIRFVGQEPIDNVTRHYNETMKRVLPTYDIEVIEIPRISVGDMVISTSKVRKLLKEKDFERISKFVPETTLNYLKENYS